MSFIHGEPRNAEMHFSSFETSHSRNWDNSSGNGFALGDRQSGSTDDSGDREAAGVLVRFLGAPVRDVAAAHREEPVKKRR